MATLTNIVIHLLNEHEVATMLGVSISSIRRWRLTNKGPRFRKIGASVRYHPEDVTAWLSSRPAGGELQKTEAR